MFSLFCLPLADATSVYHQFSRLHALSEWWHWLLLVVICLAVVTYITALYRRDSVELPSGVKWLLLTLRVLAFLGILFYFFNLEKRSERQLTKNSRALLLVDTSQSMSLQDTESTAMGSTATGSSDAGSARRRIDQVVGELAEGDLLAQLRAQHDVVAYRFDQGARPVEIASFGKRSSDSGTDSAEVAGARQQQSLREARWTALAGGGLLLISLIAGGVYLLTGRRSRGRRPAGSAVRSGDETTSWALLASMVTLIAAVVVLAVASLRSPDVGLLATLGLQEPAGNPSSSRVPIEEANDGAAAEPEVDWAEQLTPRGTETRIGDALRYLSQKERGGPVAGIVLMSDGGNNAGIEYTMGIAAAQDAGIPVYVVGLGSDKRPANVRVVDLEAPPRVFPGDQFSLTGYLQAFHLEGRTVRVELFSSSGSAGQEQAETFEEERRVTLGANGEVVPVRFEVSPGEPGRRQYKLRVLAPEQDRDPQDNEKTASVQVVERKNHVLLMGGGPTREYQFLRTLLYRDRDTTLHVLLQSGQPGISQDSDELLYDFPSTADELFQYDAIVAFDPDWQALSAAQVELLDRWVAENAGGLVVVAGPVYTPKWTGLRSGDPGYETIRTIRTLYPVVFFSRGAATLSLGRFGGDSAWPLQFTRDGQEAQFLWLEDDALGSEHAWSVFEGVYGYYASRSPKPGARVYARFSDPQTAIDNELPIYLAGHFYGSGRVFYQASGEMWRLRSLDDVYFDQYYTKLIRWVSQGRLLRDSVRGVLLVDKDRCLVGDQVAVRASLTNAQHQPLTDEEVAARVLQPDGSVLPLTLRAVKDAAREGMYAGQFTAVQEGDYRIQLRVPQSDEEMLTREVRSRVPAREMERPERNDALLQDIARRTGGQYYIGLEAALKRGAAGRMALANRLEPQDQVTYLPGTPDKDFERQLMAWLMGLISGVLCLEWLVRRLSKLA